MTDKQLITLLAVTAKDMIDGFEKVNSEATEAEKLAFMLPVKVFSDAVCDRITAPRGFEICKGFDAKIPVRSTISSAGYDFFANDTAIIPAGKSVTIHTGIKAYMNPWEVLKIYPRSSMGIKRHLTLANGVAIIDSDYYNNPDNEGEIMICLYNFGKETQMVSKGERIAQGIFETFESGSDVPTATRIGGIGSTGK